MKNVLCVLVVATLLVATSGCANGPLRNFFRGAPCNTCNPPLGSLGSGWGGSKLANCSNGVCTTPPMNEGQLPDSTEPYSTAKNPADQYPYPGDNSSTLGGLSPIDSNTVTSGASGQIWQNQPSVTGSGAAGALNGYVNPPSVGPLPQPRGN